MVFSSLTFLFIFLPPTLVFYWLAPRPYKNGVLFFVSLIFYAWGEPIYIGLMLFSTLVDYTLGLLVDKYRGKAARARIFLLASMIINLGLLGVFKYADWFLVSLNHFFSLDLPLLGLSLPIGISFYTFQTMSYTIDVYRGDAPVQKNIISLGAYVALFPQLIAGPIVRYNTIARQIDCRQENVDLFGNGVHRFVIGLGKKVLLANNMGLLYNQVVAGARHSAAGAWLGIMAFAFQIYFDFSGYSDMAIGLAGMFGFTLLENFNYPYTAQSITDFWRRWHISLGTWFRDYVYIPLGGSRRGLGATYRNIFIVWLLTGLWHGASWNFLLWGLYFALFLALEKAFLLKFLQKMPSCWAHIYALVVVSFSWVLFAFEDWADIKSYWWALLGRGAEGLITAYDTYLLANYVVLLLIAVLAATPWAKSRGRPLWENGPGCLRQSAAYLYPLLTLAILILSTAYLVDDSYNPFLYFRF